MSGDSKLDSLEAHFEQFRMNNQAHQIELQTILKEYGQLLEDYKGLKKYLDDNHGKYGSHSANNKDGKKPYVLLLVDGNGYIFNDELVKEREEGGMRAARELNKVVEHFLHENLQAPANTRIIVRIYCDLTNLSKVLARFKLTGMEKRSLSSFTAGFTRALPLFDYVDALDEEGTRFKIRESFKMAVEDSSCSHILFAACADPAYLSQLASYRGMRSKITLVQAGAFNPEYHRFNLEITQFPTVFRWSDHTSSAKSTKGSVIVELEDIPKKPKKSKAQDHSQSYNNFKVESWRKERSEYGDPRHTPAPSGSSQATTPVTTAVNVDPWGSSIPIRATKALPHAPPCKYFTKGFCRIGNKCTFAHVQPNPTDDLKFNDIADRSIISDILPSSTVPGFIPLNKDSQRIDTYIRPPTAEEWAIYNARFRKQRPCNNFHLRHNCTEMNCAYDHSELEPEARHTLEYVVKSSPCPKKGDCRSADCPHGHICQKDNCTGQMRGCSMPKFFHIVDPKLQSMVAVEPDVDSPPPQSDTMPPLIPTDGMW